MNRIMGDSDIRLIRSLGEGIYVPCSPIGKIETLLIGEQGYESNPLVTYSPNCIQSIGTRRLEPASHAYLRDIYLLMGLTTLHIKESKESEKNLEAAVILYGGIDYKEKSRKGSSLFIPSSSFSMSMLLSNGIVSAFFFDLGSGLVLFDNWYSKEALGKTHPKDSLIAFQELDPIASKAFPNRSETVQQIKKQKSWQVLPDLVMLAVDAYSGTGLSKKPDTLQYQM